MALRYCVYKDCPNYYNMSDKSYSKENVTLFQFPKDHQRRQKWLQLGKAQANLAASLYYYCSDHFDKKYKSEHHRRTILVGQAVPYAHESVAYAHESKPVNTQTDVVIVGYTKEMPIEYCLYDDEDEGERDGLNCTTVTVKQQHEDQDLQVESTTMMEDDIIQLVQHSIDSGDDLLQINEKSLCSDTKTFNNSAYKRKAPSPITTCNTKKVKAFTLSAQASSGTNNPTLKKNVSVPNVSAKCRRPTPPVDYADHDIINNQNSNSHLEEDSNSHLEESSFGYKTVAEEEDSIDPESLVDCKHATTFIFKGEEYVQMPKDYYVKEKIELLKKLQKMESVIESIKNQLDSL